MAATTSLVLLISLYSDKMYLNIAMLSYFSFLVLTCFILIFTLYSIVKSNKKDNCSKNSSTKLQTLPMNDEVDTVQQLKRESSHPPEPEKLAHSLILEILPSNSPKWDSLFSISNDFDINPDDKSMSLCEEKKKRKKRVKKKKAEPIEPIEEGKKQLVCCLYPFTKSSSATQRRIKQNYDQLVKSHGSKGLTLTQIGSFVNCLAEARNELQHKSDVIKRRFTITKALLFKADRSSFDRIRQQMYKLELEQKRLEEDAFVYNWLQEQLKISPAYKKMLEIGACMEMKEKTRELIESPDDADVTFEEFLAQEKKDAFWQRNGRFKKCAS